MGACCSAQKFPSSSVDSGLQQGQHSTYAKASTLPGDSFAADSCDAHSVQRLTNKTEAEYTEPQTHHLSIDARATDSAPGSTPSLAPAASAGAVYAAQTWSAATATVTATHQESGPACMPGDMQGPCLKAKSNSMSPERQSPITTAAMLAGGGSTATVLHTTGTFMTSLTLNPSRRKYEQPSCQCGPVTDLRDTPELQNVLDAMCQVWGVATAAVIIHGSEGRWACSSRGCPDQERAMCIQALLDQHHECGDTQAALNSGNSWSEVLPPLLGTRPTPCLSAPVKLWEGRLSGAVGVADSKTTRPGDANRQLIANFAELLAREAEASEHLASQVLPTPVASPMKHYADGTPGWRLPAPSRRTTGSEEPFGSCQSRSANSMGASGGAAVSGGDRVVSQAAGAGTGLEVGAGPGRAGAQGGGQPPRPRASDSCVLLVDTRSETWPVLYASSGWRHLTGLSTSAATSSDIESLFELSCGGRGAVVCDSMRNDAAMNHSFLTPKVHLQSQPGQGAVFIALFDNVLEPLSSGTADSQAPRNKPPPSARTKAAEKAGGSPWQGLYFATLHKCPSTRPGESTLKTLAPPLHANPLLSLCSVFEGLRPGHVVGEGRYGIVYLCTWHGARVAVKVQDYLIRSYSDQHAAETEVRLGQLLSHPHLTRTVAFAAHVLDVSNADLQSSAVSWAMDIPATETSLAASGYLPSGMFAGGRLMPMFQAVPEDACMQQSALDNVHYTGFSVAGARSKAQLLDARISTTLADLVAEQSYAEMCAFAGQAPALAAVVVAAASNSSGGGRRNSSAAISAGSERNEGQGAIAKARILHDVSDASGANPAGGGGGPVGAALSEPGQYDALQVLTASQLLHRLLPGFIGHMAVGGGKDNRPSWHEPANSRPSAGPAAAPLPQATLATNSSWEFPTAAGCAIGGGREGLLDSVVSAGVSAGTGSSHWMALVAGLDAAAWNPIGVQAADLTAGDTASALGVVSGGKDSQSLTSISVVGLGLGLSSRTHTTHANSHGRAVLKRGNASGPLWQRSAAFRPGKRSTSLPSPGEMTEAVARAAGSPLQPLQSLRQPPAIEAAGQAQGQAHRVSSTGSAALSLALPSVNFGPVAASGPGLHAPLAATGKLGFEGAYGVQRFVAMGPHAVEQAHAQGLDGLAPEALIVPTDSPGALCIVSGLASPQAPADSPTPSGSDAETAGVVPAAAVDTASTFAAAVPPPPASPVGSRSQVPLWLGLAPRRSSLVGSGAKPAAAGGTLGPHGLSMPRMARSSSTEMGSCAMSTRDVTHRRLPPRQRSMQANLGRRSSALFQGALRRAPARHASMQMLVPAAAAWAYMQRLPPPLPPSQQQQQGFVQQDSSRLRGGRDPSPPSTLWGRAASSHLPFIGAPAQVLGVDSCVARTKSQPRLAPFLPSFDGGGAADGDAGVSLAPSVNGGQRHAQLPPGFSFRRQGTGPLVGSSMSQAHARLPEHALSQLLMSASNSTQPGGGLPAANSSQASKSSLLLHLANLSIQNTNSVSSRMSPQDELMAHQPLWHPIASAHGDSTFSWLPRVCEDGSSLSPQESPSPRARDHFDDEAGVVTAAGNVVSYPLRLRHYIVMEFMDAGCLQDAIDQHWLHHARSPSEPLNLRAILATAIEVASALAYLHEHNTCHCDLSASNVLLRYTHTAFSGSTSGRQWSAKVCDLGMSVQLEEGQDIATIKEHGAITHCAPETLEHHIVSKAGDVYSLGVILWQMLVGDRPWRGLSHHQILVKVCTDKEKLPFPDSAHAGIKALARSCLDADRHRRPAAAEALRTAKHLLEEMTGELLS